jgi:transcriptional regulator with XRE-family HTH domain
MNQSYLRQNLLALIEAHNNISESELARKTGVPQPTINRLLSGVTPDPRVSTVRDLARFFEVRIEQLLGDEDLPDCVQVKKIISNDKPRSLPLIAWEHIPVWQSITNKKRLLLDDEPLALAYTRANASPSAYAISIKDRLLHKYFPYGSILVIDPLLQPQSNEYIIAHLIEEEVTTLASVISLQNNHQLAIQYNKQKINLNDNRINFCGTVIEAIIPMVERK